MPGVFNSFVYKYIRPSKAKRSFEYANRLIDCGISTPFPIAYLENSSAFGLKSSYYISLHIDYDFEFRELIHKPLFPERDKILKQFAEFTFKLHENNVNFLDHSPGNTLITKDETDYNFYLIDLNRMRFETMTFDKRMHNFRRLWLSKTMVKVIAKMYAELYNKTYQDTHDAMLKHSRSFQLKINSKKLRRSGRKMRFKS
ncbi:lipopolysaccharide kinase InaA family protein [Olleya sp. R77988]|uniref:lipopolysaccharide kinase InaA family protein n=1 Tax=Olleya sp. R77988 TaxID=3093875 RepID=UPI0037C85287